MIKYITPQCAGVQSYLATINGISIHICTNINDVLQRILSKNSYCCISESELDEQLFTIYLLKSEAIKEEYTVREDIPLALEKIVDQDYEYPNEKYQFGSQLIIFYSYPNNTIIINEPNNNYCTIIASNIDVLTFHLKNKIKEILIKNLENCALHASAVAFENKAFVFMGESNSGKSTLAYNLTYYGWELVNDDLVFIEAQKETLRVKGAEVNPCIREAALPYLLDSDKFHNTQAKYYNPYHKCYYLQELKKANKDCTLKALFVLTNDKDNYTFPTIIDRKISKRGLLERFLRFDMDDSIYLKLSNVPIYKINVKCSVENISRFLRTL